MGGCCCGNKILKMNKDIILNSDLKENEAFSFKEPDILSGQKLDKEITKKEKEKDLMLPSDADNLKTDMDDKKKRIGMHLSSKSNPVNNIDEIKDKTIGKPMISDGNQDNNNNNNNMLKINKKPMLKKGSNRVQVAMHQLKLLTLVDMNNKKFFS